MKLTVLLGMVALGVTAYAGSNTYKVNINQDSVIEGKAFKAGEYKVSFENGNAIIKQGKNAVEVPAREEEGSKVASTELIYQENTNLKEIRVGGTSTRIVFEGASPMHSGL
jgi:hypothetical protein